MDPRLSETETAFRDLVRREASSIGVAADDIDQGVTTAASAIGRLATANILGICAPETHGGGGGGPVELALASEEVGAVSASVGVVAVGHMVSSFLLDILGTPTQRQKWLPAAVEGSTLLALVLDCGGSLLESPSCGVSGKKVTDRLYLDGRARAVTGSTLADFLIVPVEVGDTFLLAVVDADRDGVTVGIEAGQLGLNGAGQAPVEFSGVQVPSGSTLSTGNVVETMKMADDLFRIGHAGLCVGIGRAALEASTAHVSGVNDELCREQSVQWMLADMATETEAARLLTWYAASRTSPGEMREAAPMARLLAADAAVRGSRSAVQIFGPAGNERGSGIERLYRDAKAMEIYHGAVEVQRLAVAGELLPRLVKDINPWQ